MVSLFQRVHYLRFYCTSYMARALNFANKRGQIHNIIVRAIN